MFSTLTKLRPFKFINSHYKLNNNLARQYSCIASQHYEKKSLFNQTWNAFHASSSLHFDNQHELNNSSLHNKLLNLFHNHFGLKPNNNIRIKTLSMRDTLQILDLDQTYAELINDDYYFIGIHGTSIMSLPNIIPYPSMIKNMGTFHNPYHNSNQPICFFYGDNLRISLHYSEINSISTEHITGDSDPHHYPDRVAILGFASKALIDHINNNNVTQYEKDRHITVAETIAWIQPKSGIPDECKIGNEIRIPSFYHSQISNLLVFGMKGGKRSTPLDRDIQYHEGKQCHWKKGVGYIEINNEPEQMSPHNRC